MMDIALWIENFMKALQDNFAERIFFVGLQGSYGRGEATAASDIDMVVILDVLTPDDVQTYNAMLDGLPNRELACGFLSGRKELENWEPSDLFQFYHDTKPIFGTLDELMTVIDDTAVTRAIKIGACNIFHGCVHNMLYEKSSDILYGLYKSASFVVQAISFRETGVYTRLQKDLLPLVSAEERVVVETFLELKQGGTVRFREMSVMLMGWAQGWIEKTGQQPD